MGGRVLGRFLRVSYQGGGKEEDGYEHTHWYSAYTHCSLPLGYLSLSLTPVFLCARGTGWYANERSSVCWWMEEGRKGYRASGFLLLLAGCSWVSGLVCTFLVWTLVTVVLSPDDGAVHPFCSPREGVPRGGQNKPLCYGL